MAGLVPAIHAVVAASLENLEERRGVVGGCHKVITGKGVWQRAAPILPNTACYRYSAAP
jgi:hypothetical protein